MIRKVLAFDIPPLDPSKKPRIQCSEVIEGQRVDQNILQGYFVTEEKLKEFFEAGGSREYFEEELSGMDYTKEETPPTFDEFLSQQLQGER